MEMKSRVVQLCIDVGTWNMTTFLGLGRIQVKGEIVRIWIRIRHGGSQKLQRSRRIVVHSQCTV